ncbi:uncharacterized protein F4822DRAFT_432933 [Hypoxylon trugodes]|uniref:uncharacterized protein n=1 Tax=Hypoxylon trugodes TaxID=326681 RepID=UPI00219E076E|nr:uncharacterized protein F4822DRAFT_432933 [Hypoxylon trugodes]KAI1384386.1 hypothetical protein F4822DRAFT_432933 [Hypoxylon trugodes]
MDAATLEAFLDTPAMPAPEGVTPVFDNPPNQNSLGITVLTVCLVISTVCVCLRAYARVYLLRKVQVEEILIFSAYAVFIAQMYAGYALIAQPGYFVHQYNLKMRDMVQPTFTILLMGCFYQTVLPLLKTAILLEWCRLLTPPGNRWKSFFWLGCVGVIFIQVSFGIACVILLNMQCTPHVSIWEFWRPERKCFDLISLQLASGSIQLFSDVAMLLLPQKTIWTLQLSWQKRLGVSVVFGLGVFACVSAAVRLSVTVTFGYNPDQMYALGPLVFWVDAESTCAFFIVCMPCLPKILREQGIIHRIKKVLGMKLTQQGLSYGGDSKAAKYGYGSKYSTGDSYRKLDEERGGVPLGDMKTESTERLRRPEDAEGKIVKTTQVTVQVTADTPAENDTKSRGRIGGQPVHGSWYN